MTDNSDKESEAKISITSCKSSAFDKSKFRLRERDIVKRSKKWLTSVQSIQRSNSDSRSFYNTCFCLVLSSTFFFLTKSFVDDI